MASYSCVLYNKKIKPNYTYEIISEDTLELYFPHEIFDVTHLLLKDNSKTIEEYEYEPIVTNTDKTKFFIPISRPKYVTENIDISNYVANPEKVTILYDGITLSADIVNKVPFTKDTFQIDKLQVLSQSSSNKYPNYKINYTIENNILKLYYGNNYSIGNVNGYKFQSLISINLPTFKNGNSQEYTGEIISIDDIINYDKNKVTAKANEMLNAGVYTISFSINNPSQYCWNGEYSDLIYTIAKKMVTIDTSDTNIELTNTNNKKFIQITTDTNIPVSVPLEFNISKSIISNLIIKQDDTGEFGDDWISFSVEGKIDTDASIKINISLSSDMNNYQSNTLTINVSLSSFSFDWKTATWKDIKELCKISNAETIKQYINIMDTKQITENYNACVVDISDNNIVFIIQEPIAKQVQIVGPYNATSSSGGNFLYFCNEIASNLKQYTDYYNYIKTNITVPYVENGGGSGAGDFTINSISNQTFFVPGAAELGATQSQIETNLLSVTKNKFNLTEENIKKLAENDSYGFLLRDFYPNNATASRYIVNKDGLTYTSSVNSRYDVKVCFVIGKEEN